MNIEYTEEMIEGALKNPYFDKLCKKVEVVVRNEDYALFEKIARENDVPIESVLKRCLKVHAQMLREDEILI